MPLPPNKQLALQNLKAKQDAYIQEKLSKKEETQQNQTKSSKEAPEEPQMQIVGAMYTSPYNQRFGKYSVVSEPQPGTGNVQKVYTPRHVLKDVSTPLYDEINVDWKKIGTGGKEANEEGKRVLQKLDEQKQKLRELNPFEYKKIVWPTTNAGYPPQTQMMSQLQAFKEAEQKFSDAGYKKGGKKTRKLKRTRRTTRKRKY